MAIQELPNFWSYLMQGVPQGFQMQQQMQERQDRQRQLDAANALQGAQLALGANDRGQMSYTQANQAISNAAKFNPGLAGLQLAGPSSAEMRRNIATASGQNVMLPGVPGMASMPTMLPFKGDQNYTDTQREYAGLQTSDQKATEALQRKLLGAQVRGAEFGASPEMQNMEMFKRRMEAFDQISEGAASQAVNAIGGFTKIRPDNISKLVDQGFSQLQKTGALKMFGQLSPETEQYLKNNMHSKLMDAYMKYYGIEAQVRAAGMRTSMGSKDPRDIWFDNLERSKQNALGQINQLRQELGKFNPMFLTMTPQQREKLKNVVDFAQIDNIQQQLSAAQQQYLDISTAQSKLANGTLVDADLYKALGRQPEQGVTVPGGGNAGQAAPQPPAVAPQGQQPARLPGVTVMAPPQGSAPTQPKGPPADMSPEALTETYSFLARDQATFMSKLEQAVKNNEISLNDARKLGYRK